MTLIQCPECAKTVSSEAPACPTCGYAINPSNAEPAFRRYLSRKITALFILCLVGLPVGLLMKLPGVWGLALLGIVFAPIIKPRVMRRERGAAN